MYHILYFHPVRDQADHSGFKLYIVMLEVVIDLQYLKALVLDSADSQADRASG